jgi:Na+/proline symporter
VAQIREYYENHPLAFAVVIALAVASSLVGLVLTGWIGVAVGFLIGAIGFFVIPRVKIREIARDREADGRM